MTLFDFLDKHFIAFLIAFHLIIIIGVGFVDACLDELKKWREISAGRKS